MRNKLFKMLYFEKPHFQMEMRVAVTLWHFHVTLVPYFLAGLTFTHINRLITIQYSSSWCLSKFTLFKVFVYNSKYFHILVAKSIKRLTLHAYYKLAWNILYCWQKKTEGFTFKWCSTLSSAAGHLKQNCKVSTY